MNLTFRESRILKHIFNWWNALFEEIHAELFKFSSGNADVEIIALS
jgi:hypothetical protein